MRKDFRRLSYGVVFTEDVITVFLKELVRLQGRVVMRHLVRGKPVTLLSLRWDDEGWVGVREAALVEGVPEPSSVVPKLIDKGFMRLNWDACFDNGLPSFGIAESAGWAFARGILVRLTIFKPNKPAFEVGVSRLIGTLWSG